jgi:hypothetical protein
VTQNACTQATCWARAATLAAGVLLASAATAGAADEPRGLGFRPVPHAALTERYQAPLSLTMLPGHLDWRDAGIITPAKDQRTCGACWAFAAIGLMEAMSILHGGAADADFSEQAVVSCDHDSWWVGSTWVSNDGCCSGTIAVFEYLTMNEVVAEEDFAFAEGDSAGTRDCGGSIQTINVVACPRENPPDGLGWHVTEWNVVGLEDVATVEEMRTALQNGPLWVGFYAYDDFRSYWNAGLPTTYRHSGGGSLEGGHAVLLIGYDDAGQYWICKNSWGAKTGPWQDGTFRMAYASNCDFGLNAATARVRGGATHVSRSTSWGRIRAAFRP